MISFTQGHEFANIYRKETRKDIPEPALSSELITKLKIQQSFQDHHDIHVSKKDENLIVEDNLFELPDDYTMRLSPTHDKDQNLRMVIIAPSGAGKSTFVKNYILDYKKKYPKKDVFLFSRHSEDPSIDDAKPKRIQISETEIIESIKKRVPLFENKNLANSLIIFDDTFTAESKILTNFWDGLATDLYQNGRKLGIDLIFVMHNTNYSRTRFLMSEASHYTFFLRAGSKAMYQRLLESYLGYKDKKIQKKLFDLPSRYVVFSNQSPQYIMTENQAFTDSHITFSDSNGL